MAYGTPVFDYEKGRGQLAQSKAVTDQANEFGRFLSQERFRRQRSDMGRDFKRNFPRVGASFNRRGAWNSGLRKRGQQQYVSDVNRNLDRLAGDQAAADTQFDMARTRSDVDYQGQLLDLYDRMQAARAAGYDPFAGFR